MTQQAATRVTYPTHVQHVRHRNRPEQNQSNEFWFLQVKQLTHLSYGGLRRKKVLFEEKLLNSAGGFEAHSP